jgi:hypothetical protein
MDTFLLVTGWSSRDLILEMDMLLAGVTHKQLL